MAIDEDIVLEAEYALDLGAVEQTVREHAHVAIDYLQGEADEEKLVESWNSVARIIKQRDETKRKLDAARKRLQEKSDE